MLALIVATEIQLFLNENDVRFPTVATRRVHKAAVNIATQPGDYFNGILNTDLPDLQLNAPNIRYVTHQSKWRDLRTLIEKVFRFVLLINH